MRGRRRRSAAERSSCLRPTVRPSPPASIALRELRHLRRLPHRRSPRRSLRGGSRHGVLPNLVSRVEFYERAPRSHVPHSTGGRVERRRHDQRRGLRLHVRGVSESTSRKLESIANVRGVRALDAKTVRIALASLIRGLAIPVRGRASTARARGGSPRGDHGSTRIDNPKTGRPIGSGPFLVERWRPRT